MPPSKGYRSYRGRGSKLKVALAVVLVLIILLALSFMAMTRYIAYDEDGRPFFRLPPQEETEAPPPAAGKEDLTGDIQIEEPPDIIIQGPERPLPLFAFSLPQELLTAETWEAALAAHGEPYDTVVYTVKDADSTAYFATDNAIPGLVRRAKEATTEALAAMNGSELHTVARLTCFHDFKTANANREDMGLKNTGGYIFYDGTYTTWLDPAKPAARAYLQAMAVELAGLGFDEILLTEVSYPTEGKLDKIAYTADGPLHVDIELFLQELRAALEGYEITLSIELPEKVITEGQDDTAGLRLKGVIPYVDRIYARTAPETAEALREAVEEAGEKVSFVPELAEAPAEGFDETGYLVLS